MTTNQQLIEKITNLEKEIKSFKKTCYSITKKGANKEIIQINFDLLYLPLTVCMSEVLYEEQILPWDNCSLLQDSVDCYRLGLIENEEAWVLFYKTFWNSIDNEYYLRSHIPTLELFVKKLKKKYLK